jgi:hypothetical protein
MLHRAQCSVEKVSLDPQRCNGAGWDRQFAILSLPGWIIAAEQSKGGFEDLIGLRNGKHVVR